MTTYTIERTLRSEAHRTVHVASKGGRRFFLQEYDDPSVAEHESDMVGALSVPTVPPILDRYTEGGKAYLAREFEELTPCGVHIEALKGIESKLRFFRRVLLSLKEIHAQGVVVNAISLENIGIAANDAVRFLDFSVAHREDAAPEDRSSRIPNPLYVAPERTGKVSGPIDRRSDQYAMGVLLYRILTGQFPFQSADISQLVSLHVAKRPEAPHGLNSEIPRGLSRVVEKLLEKSPEERYHSVSGILWDLEHYPENGFQPGAGDVRREFTISQKIYGREEETEILRSAAQQITQGERHLVTISGYSGVGKSTIVEEFQRLREEDGTRLVSGKFQQYKKDIPYFAIIEAFEQLFDLLLLSREEVLDDFREEFTREIGDQGLILTSIFPSLEMIVGPQLPVDELVGEEAENRFNYVFLKLLRIVATQDHPLVLFLDDLQWTDLVSLKVLRALLRSDLEHLLIVLSYRSNEVDSHHPFQRLLDETATSGTPSLEIRVEDLQPEDVAQLVADSLGKEDPPLSSIVFEKTHGNAFFVHQLLKGLADRGLFVRDSDAGFWTIDPDQVSGIEVSENVVEFMQTRLERFPSEVLDLLRVTGAVGHRTDLDVLSVVTGHPAETVLAILQLPLEDGLMHRPGQDEVVFSHDKIQEACYQLNEEADLPRLHFTIAETLMLHGRTSTLEEIFNLAGHLDRGFEYIGDTREKCLAIYLLAARKSKEISAYEEFLVYVRQAMKLLDDTIPSADRYNVYREYHIALYLNSLFEEADAFFEEHLLDYPDVFELQENYFSKVSQDSMRGRYQEATEFGMAILQRMGIDLKINPTLEELTEELAEVEALFDEAGIGKISDLQRIPRRNIQEMEFVSEVILAMVPAAFFFNPTVACLLIFTTLKLATRNGVFEAMGYPLSVASTPFILIRNDYRAGYEYAEYAIQIAANNKRSLGNSKHLFILFCWHWSQPMKDDTALEIARDAHHLLMQGGDIQMAGYTYYNTITYLWERGEHLEVVLAEARKGLEFNVSTQNAHGIGLVTPHNQVVLTLLSEDGDFLRLGREGFDEDEFVKENTQNTMGLCFFYIFKTQLAYLCGAYDSAYTFSVKAREILHFITGFPSTMSGIFYGALCRVEKFSPSDEEWAGVQEDLNQLKEWSHGAPENFRHKLLLLEAEMARKEGNIEGAIRKYSEAISAARDSRFTHETALINERFSDFWFGIENAELGSYYARQAHHYFGLWGADRKLRLLEEKHPELNLSGEGTDLDLMSVIRAQNVLAQETQVDALLREMMQVLMEFSGAEKVCLILEGNPWRIEAYRDAQGGERILKGIEPNDRLLSADMVNYVIRTGRPVQLEHFSGLLADGYVKLHEPKSILVLPVAVGGELIAVIYLEHSKIRGLFSHDRQEAITLLSSQIAISLNNAKVYDHLEDLVEKRTDELARQNKLLATARDRADKANEAKSRFLANMSHELRTPLNAVTGYAELLSGLVSDPRQQNYLKSIKTAGRNLLNLINDILDLSKIEADRMELSPAPVSLRMICEEIRQIFSLSVHEKGLEFILAYSGGLPDLLYLDETRIRQVLLNLVGNAIKFTESGFVQLSARCLSQTGPTVDLEIVVRDSGIGIPMPDQERIFQSFEQQTSQDHARYGGTGLGLSITKRLVSLMGGGITLESSPGKGSSFTVILKSVRSASSGDQILASADEGTDEIFFARGKILVVDDIDSNREFLTELLRRMELDPFSAANGQEALLVASEMNPDLIFMDLRMPVMDGFQAVKRLKTNPATRSIPVVALTASPSQGDRQLAIDQGFDGFLTKPLGVRELTAELSKHLEPRGATAEPREERDSVRIRWEEVEDPEGLERWLVEEALPGSEGLKRALIIGDVRRYATDLEEKASRHRAEPLARFARGLLRKAQAVDVPAIMRELDALPKVVGEDIDSGKSGGDE